MSFVSLLKERQPNYKSKVILFSLISIIIAATAYVVAIFAAAADNAEFSIRLIISMLISFVLFILPSLYIMNFIKSKKKKSTIHLIFIIIILTHIIDNINYGPIGLIVLVICAIAFSLATISASKGFLNKSTIAFAIIVGFANEIINFIRPFINFFSGNDTELFNFFIGFLSALSYISLYIALQILVTNYRTEDSVSSKKHKKITFEETLKLLKDEFDSGEITEEEYNAKKSALINDEVSA